MYPKLFSYGDFFLPTYGVMVALAFYAGLHVTLRLGQRRGLPVEKLTNLVIYCALMGLAGAKLLMFVFDFDYWRRNPDQIFTWSTLQAAGVFQGGLVLATGFAFWYLRRERLPVLETADVLSPAVALGHAIGRLGCFAVGCCWGVVCDRPWAVTFRNPEANQLTGVPLNTPLHPTQLYEFGAELALFAWLWVRAGQQPAAGTQLGWYLVISSAMRFGIEFFRTHAQASPWGLALSLTQWIALGLAGAGVVLLLRKSQGGTVESAA
jgi:phosphatidylglycerol:prolipoprotein diacylglycerol transferase